MLTTTTHSSNHFLIENIYCNWSGGCAIGSLGTNTDIYEITYQNVYSQHCNQMFMFKSNGGNGSVYDSQFTNFIGHDNAYSLYIDGEWTQAALADGDGVLYTDLQFEDWSGDCADGTTRPPIIYLCPDGAPCDALTATNIDIWTDEGSEEYYRCQNAWGTGECLRSGTQHTAYSISTVTVTATP